MTNPERLMAAYLRERGIDKDYALRAGARPVDTATATAMGFPLAHRSQGGVVWPYLHPLTQEPHPTLMRIRYLGELPRDNEGEEVRFVQPRNSDVEAFFDANVDWMSVFRDESIRIVITEGEAKAIALNQHWREYNAAVVGLGGVWNFRDKTRDLTPWLRMVRAASQNRRGVLVVLDQDMQTNKGIRRAGETLVQLMGLKYVCKGIATW